MNAIIDINVATVFESYPETQRQALLKLRQLIFDTAEKLIAVGEIEESLKWGQPSYSTKAKNIGTPIRIGIFENDKIAMFVHCQTTLIESFRNMFDFRLAFSDNRAIILDPTKELPIDELSTCIEMALTYHKK